MEPIPVEHTRTPAYPTRRELLAGAASFVLFGLAGRNDAFAEASADAISVAPIFEHGTGRGAAGCVVVSPPAFLSEEEAMQIIGDELAKHGVELKAGDTLTGVSVPIRVQKFEKIETPTGETEYKTSIAGVPGSAKPLVSDGLDAGRKIAVEFVSQEDYFHLGGVRSWSTVQEYKFKETAAEFASLVKKQGNDRIFLGIFYDPAARAPFPKTTQEGAKVDWRTAWKKQREQSKEESGRLLRQQAEDFAAWLKKQKAIP